FFFSSRRRHTRFKCDWSSDVCSSDLGKIACNQVLYHLQERAIEHAVIPWCGQHGVAVVAYSPFGHDDFPERRSAGGEVLQRIARSEERRVGEEGWCRRQRRRGVVSRC